MKIWGLALAASVAFLMSPVARAGVDPLVERGKYLVGFGSCNDCHTPGWRESDGKVPVSAWMTGSKIGYRGPWGTSYAANVRIEFTQITENDWLFMVRTRAGRWPMVWHNLRTLKNMDQRAIYRFVRSLGPRGKRVPADVPPGREPSTPYVWVVPH